MNGLPCRPLLDTGASRSLVSLAWVQKHRLPLRKPKVSYRMKPATGHSVALPFATTIDVTLPDGTVNPHTFLVADRLDPELIIGMDFQRRHVHSISPASGLVTFSPTPAPDTSAASLLATAAPAESGELEPPLWCADYKDVFTSVKVVPQDFRHGHVFELKTTDDALPPPASPFEFHPKEHDEAIRITQDWLTRGYCRPIKSPTAAPMFFVKKQCPNCGQLKDRGTCRDHRHELRHVVDYRELNKVTPQDAYPIPNIPQLIRKAAGQGFYFKFDIEQAFYLIPFSEADQFKAAFLTPLGLMAPTVALMGLKNVPACWQRLIDEVLRPHMDYCCVFFDDGTVWAPSLEILHARVRAVLESLRQAGLRIKIAKTVFDAREIQFLGHIISADGSRPDPAKTDGFAKWPEPRCKKDVLSFVNTVSYYSDHFLLNGHGLSHFTAPLNNLTRKDHEDNWSQLPDDARAAFNTIRSYWANPLSLAAYDPEQPVFLHTDASDLAIGGIISQPQGVISAYSRRLNPAEESYGTTDRELLACLEAHKRFPWALRYGDVTWYTDHEALTALKTATAENPRRLRWQEKLAEFPFRVQHMKGTEMPADGLTRHSSYTSQKPSTEPDPILSPSRFPVASAQSQKRVSFDLRPRTPGRAYSPPPASQPWIRSPSPLPSQQQAFRRHLAALHVRNAPQQPPHPRRS